MSEIPTRMTPRLILRPFDVRDIPSLLQVLEGKDVLRYFPPGKPPSTERVEAFIARQQRHWQERGYGLWAVEAKDGRHLLGRCGLQYLPDTDEIEVDFILGREYWHQGFATEAALASLRFGFEELQLNTIVGIVHREHVASRRVLVKLGMSVTEEAEYFGLPVFRYSIERCTFLQTATAREH